MCTASFWKQAPQKKQPLRIKPMKQDSTFSPFSNTMIFIVTWHYIGFYWWYLSYCLSFNATHDVLDTTDNSCSSFQFLLNNRWGAPVCHQVTICQNFFLRFSFILLFEEYFQFTRWHFNVCNSDHPCCSYLPHLCPLPPSHPLTCPHPIFVSFILRSMTSSRIPHSQVHVDIISWTKWVIKKGRET